ncbi:MAG: BlaI/MecI/CopY family transcriptional regulator [Thermoanaerobaculia bacterium]|nr:BlaI/MecI/CopY family transcriptional regulator [Thermoanaerobaculia bacterium]
MTSKIPKPSSRSKSTAGENKPLSRREREIMDIVYRHEGVGVAEVLDELVDPPSYSAARALLRILEEKGHLSHRQEGQRYVYQATVPRTEARRSALSRVVRTFFHGSVEGTVAALLEDDLSHDELDRLADLVAAARDQEEAS